MNDVLVIIVNLLIVCMFIGFLLRARVARPKRRQPKPNKVVGTVTSIDYTPKGLVIQGKLVENQADLVREGHLKGISIEYNGMGRISNITTVKSDEDDTLMHSAGRQDVYTKTIWSSYMSGTISRETALMLLRRA